MIPNVLSIAGSDPSGGAGIQADLKSIAANGGYGMAVVTALTAQNTRGVRAVHVPPAAFVGEQLDAVASDIRVDAVKIGMLANAEVVRVVTEALPRLGAPVVVLDPVMVATSGDRLLDAVAVEALGDLLRLADLVTPNLPELAILDRLAGGTGTPAADWAEAIAQAETVSAFFGVRVLAKGGHLTGPDAPDALVDAASARVVGFGGDRIPTTATHGTGCSLSSAIATRRAHADDWETAVADARRWLRESLRHGDDLAVGGGHGPVHHFAGLWSRGGLDTRPTPAEVEAQWWDDIADVRTGIDDLPFIRGLVDGTLHEAAFLGYLEQDAAYLGEYARALAVAASLAPDAAGQAFWAQSAHGAIAVELDLHRSWLAPLGRDDADAIERWPTTVAYLDHLLATAARGDHAVLAAALLPCFWLYADLGERIAAGAFGEVTGIPGHPYATWLATYGDPGFAAANRDAIDLVTRIAASATADVRERMRRAFRVSAEHELAFFAAPLLRSPGAPAAATTVG
ncbi:bifunctional hydroxymethylpyrimidine kinase/phosphomethylpyrimidine kinase [Microbacterium mangrovi]|uniref:bifunctional hydroxymethylpyrimidine kinase/phosphomethylpyrimidine kinase n=1 Tax=Microbacterium mangrovi TaxID=1348253 RepID=UPI00069111D0